MTSYVYFRRSTGNFFVPAFYIVKCLHLLVSAWQIRNGYPRLCIGNILTRSYGLLHFILFLIYMKLPLMFEIRTIVDWTWTRTTMPLFDFIKMEVFYSRIFLVKCSRELERASLITSLRDSNQHSEIPITKWGS